MPKNRDGFLIGLAIASAVVAATGVLAWFALSPAHGPTSQANPERPLVPDPRPVPDLAAVLQFEDPSNCEAAEPLLSIQKALVEAYNNLGKDSAAKPIFVAELDRDVMPVIVRTDRADDGDLIETTLPLEGLWHGLHVARLKTSAPPESDDISDAVYFLEAPDRVRSVLNAKGFSIPAVETWRETRTGSETPGSIGIFRDGRETALICS